jgi:REP element-mobilizing transposase RayT
MNFEAHQLYHAYNQGNNRQAIFHFDNDYDTFKSYLKQFILPFAEIIAYCLMPNHFHLLIYARENCSVLVRQGGIRIGSLNNGFRKLLSGYCRVFNCRYHQSGSLFRQKTKAKWLGGGIRIANRPYTCEEYCWNCFQYIHENPVAAGLVKNSIDWKWSSAGFYAGNKADELCNLELAKKYCGYEPGQMSKRKKVDSYWKKMLEE